MVAAGCIFTDGKLVLAGYHPQKGYITGIGGKSCANETPINTAFREMLEELFLVFDYPFLNELIALRTPKLTTVTQEYTNHVFSLNDLTDMLRLLSAKKLVSPFYKVFPTTVGELVLNRRITDSSEISHLVILPVLSEIVVANHFIRDVIAVSKLLNR